MGNKINLDYLKAFNNPVLGYTTEYYSEIIENQKRKSDESSESYAIQGFLHKGQAVYLHCFTSGLFHQFQSIRDKSNQNKKSKLHKKLE